MCPKVNSILCNYPFESTKHKLKPPQCCNFDRWNDKTKTMDQHVLKPKICRHSPVESMMNKSNFIREQFICSLNCIIQPHRLPRVLLDIHTKTRYSYTGFSLFVSESFTLSFALNPSTRRDYPHESFNMHISFLCESIIHSYPIMHVD